MTRASFKATYSTLAKFGKFENLLNSNINEAKTHR